MKPKTSSQFGPDSLSAADTDTLRAHLQGQGLPTLGSDVEPAEIILRALGRASNPDDLGALLAPKLARVIDVSIEELQEKKNLPPSLRLLLVQALWLAADLPPNPELADSLRRLIIKLNKGSHFWTRDPLAPPMVRALVYQQTDSKAELIWLHLLKSLGQVSPLSAQQRTILLSAWRGLLYIPIDQEKGQASRAAEQNLSRIERGLRALTTGMQPREDCSQLIHQVLLTLDNAFPRGVQTWAVKLASLLSNCPPVLWKALTLHMPEQISTLANQGTSVTQATQAPIHQSENHKREDNFLRQGVQIKQISAKRLPEPKKRSLNRSRQYDNHYGNRQEKVMFYEGFRP